MTTTRLLILIAAILNLPGAVLAQGFKWVITENGVPPAATATEAPSLASYQHTLKVGNGLVSCTHIGDGWYVSCGHVFNGRRGQSSWIDGVPQAISYMTSPADFSLLRAPGLKDYPHVAYVATPISRGMRLTVCGRITGVISGAAKTEATDGTWSILIDEGMPLTQSGDSGSGVYTESGDLIGVHLGSYAPDHTTRVLPLSLVRNILTAPFNGERAPAGAAQLGQVAAAPVPPAAAAELPPRDGWALFTATWCGPCKTAKAQADALRATYGPPAPTIIEIDVDMHRDLCDKYRIKLIPTWVRFENGVAVERYSQPDFPGE